MVSENQHAASDKNPSLWERAFSDAYDLKAAPLLRGIDSYERALRAHKKAHKYNASKREKEYIAAKLGKYDE